MSDVKLFRVLPAGVEELSAGIVAVERSLQTLIERHLSTFLGLRLLASDYPTGRTHGGRIDTLAIDENGSPVIVEYKRSLHENVINQGLFYLDWLLDHRAEFTLLAIDHLGKPTADGIEWTSPRLVCIASDFTRYDEHAIKQIRRNIELIRYRRYGEEFLLLELVNAASVEGGDAEVQVNRAPARLAKIGRKRGTKTVADRLKAAPQEVRDWYATLASYLTALGDEVQVKTLTTYVAFRRLTNFACVEVQPQLRRIVVYVRVEPSAVKLEPGFTRDVRTVWHAGTGDLEIIIDSDSDLERAMPLLLNSYEAS